MEKEIKEEQKRIRLQLKEIRHIFSATPNKHEVEQWKNYVDALRPDCDSLSKMILKFNFTVPSLHKQVMGFQLDKIAEKAFANFEPEFHEICKEKAKREKLEIENSNRLASSSNDSF